MGYTELIDMLETLPRERQEEVFDFAEFLALRCRAVGKETTDGPGNLLVNFLDHPVKVGNGFSIQHRNEECITPR